MADEASLRFRAALGCEFELTRRTAGWLAVADHVVAFGADDDAGWRRLTTEAWLLERWRAADVPGPRVLREDPTRKIQIRERLNGLTGVAIHCERAASPLYPGDLPDARARLDDAALSPFGERVAASYGDLAARIRRAVSIAEATAAGLGHTARRSIDIDDAIARLLITHASAAAKRAAQRARDWLVAIPPPDAVIHADLHFFNFCTDETGVITGVFDVGDAGIDAAAQELSMVHSLGSRFAAIALDAYGSIDADAVRRAQLRNALDHIIDHGPGTPRHDSIVTWTTAAFERLV